jgi:hypothetical protein
MKILFLKMKIYQIKKSKEIKYYQSRALIEQRLTLVIKALKFKGKIILFSISMIPIH